MAYKPGRGDVVENPRSTANAPLTESATRASPTQVGTGVACPLGIAVFSRHSCQKESRQAEPSAQAVQQSGGSVRSEQHHIRSRSLPQRPDQSREAQHNDQGDVVHIGAYRRTRTDQAPSSVSASSTP